VKDEDPILVFFFGLCMFVIVLTICLVVLRFAGVL
jgi:hypothetical protein